MTRARVKKHVRRPRFFSCGLAPLVCALLFARGAFAENALTLEWRAPAECPTGDAVEREVSRLLGGAAGARRLTAVAEVTREGARWRVRLRTLSAENPGDRTMDSESCGELADATALVLAMAIDPARVAANSAPSDVAVEGKGVEAASPTANSDAFPAATASPSVSSPIPRPRARPPAPPFPRKTFALGAAARGDVGTLPNFAMGASLSFAWTPHALRLQASGTFLPANSARLLNGRGGTFDLFAAEGRGCYEVVAGVIELGPCAGFEIGALRGAGFGVRNDTPAYAFWSAVTAGGALAWRWTAAFALRLEGGVSFPLQRPEFVLAGLGAVHRPAGVLGRGGLGAEFRF